MKYIAQYQCRMCLEWAQIELDYGQIDLGMVTQAGGVLPILVSMTDHERAHKCREGVVGIAQLMGIKQEKEE